LCTIEGFTGSTRTNQKQGSLFPNTHRSLALCRQCCRRWPRPPPSASSFQLTFQAVLRTKTKTTQTIFLSTFAAVATGLASPVASVLRADIAA
jgi:hypothetical protein